MQKISQLAAALSLAGPMLALPALAATPADTSGPAVNIVIVHGDYVDGSGWRVVSDILSHQGYHVSVVQQPHTTMDADVAATREILDQQFGPVVLVGHDSGGAVIGIAGARDKVKALVYVAATLPDIGESVAQLTASMPEPSHDLHATRDGHLFIDRAKFGADFADDQTSNRTGFLALSQVPTTTAKLGAQNWTAAWHQKPSYAIVATDDHLLSPDLQRWMYQRAGAKVTEIKGSHLLYISQPEAVAQVILDAVHSIK